jgi:hypothetical protein
MFSNSSKGVLFGFPATAWIQQFNGNSSEDKQKSLMNVWGAWKNKGSKKQHLQN